MDDKIMNAITICYCGAVLDYKGVHAVFECKICNPSNYKVKRKNE
jgi:hypothetical protein